MFYAFTKTYVVSTHWKRLETLPMRTNNICSFGEIRNLEVCLDTKVMKSCQLIVDQQHILKDLNIATLY